MSEEISIKGLSQRDKNERDKNDPATLSQLFDNAFEMFNNINATVEPTNSPKVQLDIKRTMHMFEDATRLVSIVDMFSDNETFEEIATENIKYFLLPALLGKLTNQLCIIDDRLHLAKVAEIYFIDFLKRLKAYGLTDVEIPQISTVDEKKEARDNENTSESRMLENMMIRRNTKLQRYQQEKDLESRLDTLKKNLDNPNIDDEFKREYFVTLIKLYAVRIVDDLNFLKKEKIILENMKEMKSMHSTSEIQKKQKSPAPKLQPIIITRDEIQKKVFGAGYPSLPVLTVQEFYEQKIKDGEWPDSSQHNVTDSRCLQNIANKDVMQANNEDSETVLKEKKEEKDDPEYLEQLRAMDEYKDTHRRGWGNRANRS
ncbi:IGB1B protein, partial [Acromyrmex charruanus]